MHSLVQLATRKWLKSKEQAERWKQQFIASLCAAFPTGEYSNWEQCKGLFPYTRAALAQSPESEGSCNEWALLLYSAAWYAWKRGNTDEAEEMATTSMKIWTRLFSAEGGEILISIVIVRLARSLGGRWKDAEELEVQVMDTFKAKLGADHPDTLTSMSNLGSMYRSQGRRKDAEELFVQVIETRKTQLGADHLDKLISMANLASTYRNQGQWKDAEELEVQVMETRKTKLEADHSETLVSM